MARKEMQFNSVVSRQAVIHLVCGQTVGQFAIRLSDGNLLGSKSVIGLDIK